METLNPKVNPNLNPNLNPKPYLLGEGSVHGASDDYGAQQGLSGGRH